METVRDKVLLLTFGTEEEKSNKSGVNVGDEFHTYDDNGMLFGYVWVGSIWKKYMKYEYQ